MSFSLQGLECKSRKSRNTWSNRQIWPWSTEWIRARLIEFCQENALVIANTLFHNTREDYTWTSLDGQYWNQIDYILCSQRWRSCIESAKRRSGANCGLDHEFLIAKFRLKLKKVGKNTRPFRYDPNQIPYDYRLEVTNIFKGLCLRTEFLKNYGQRFKSLYRWKEQNHPKGKEMQENKMVVRGGFTNSWGKKRKKMQGEKGKINPAECRVPENSKER